MRGACITRGLIISGKGKIKNIATYRRIKFIERFDGSFEVTSVDVMLNLLSGSDRFFLLLRLKVGLLGELGSGQRISFQSQIIQDQSVDVTTCWLEHDLQLKIASNNV